ncbi:hypothetical protein SPAR24_0305 [Streptococcus pneumoniae GA11663]|nr:hypothetical protein SPAR24_0305 [Streptococcus pneumoniae GA11663]
MLFFRLKNTCFQYFFTKKFNKYKDIPSKVKKYTIPLLEIPNRSAIKKFNTLIAIAKKKYILWYY